MTKKTIAKNWCCVLLSSVAAIAIPIPEIAFAASYVPCGYTFSNNAADETIEPTERAEAYYLAANDCHRSAQRDTRRGRCLKNGYARGAVKYYTKAISLNPGRAKKRFIFTVQNFIGKLLTINRLSETIKNQIFLSHYPTNSI